MTFVNYLFGKALRMVGYYESTPELTEEEIEKMHTDIIEKINQGEASDILEKYIYDLSNNPLRSSKIAGAIVMYQHYIQSPVTIHKYLELFGDQIDPETALFMYQHQYVLEQEASENMIKDFLLGYFPARVTISTYMTKTHYDQPPKEIPQFAWLRIACGEFRTQGIEKVLEYYRELSDKRCIPSTPTIFNMGKRRGAPTSCMLFTMDDDLEDIYDVIKEIALAQKNNAGIGVDLSLLRVSGIGFNGVSQGIIPLCKELDALANYVNQGGQRPGAITASIWDCHYNLIDFIKITDQTQPDAMRVERLNTSIMFHDIFWQRVEEGGMWTMFCPKQVRPLLFSKGKDFTEKYLDYEKKALIPGSGIVYHQAPAREIAELMCHTQRKSGMPYVMHADNVNRKNNMSNIGVVRSSNLCQEIVEVAVPREQTACCNLSSLSLPAFAKDGKFDFIEFAKSVRTNIHALNRVVDESMRNIEGRKRVSDKARRSNELNRPVGLGVSGLGNLIALLDMPFTDMSKIDYEKDPYSPESLLKRQLNPELKKLVWEIWGCMYYNALIASMEEAEKYGAYPNFQGSPLSQGITTYMMYENEAKEMGRNLYVDTNPPPVELWGGKLSWDDLIKKIKKTGVRNSLMLTCMPTASSASVLGNSESTELYTQNFYLRRLMSGEYPVFNNHMVEELMAEGLWNAEVTQNQGGSILPISEDGLTDTKIQKLRKMKEKYLTMFEIPQKARLILLAQIQVFVDQALSTNLYIAHPENRVTLAIHLFTWKLGLKNGMYYLRSKAHGKMLKYEKVEKKTEVAPACRMEDGCLHCE